MGTSTSIALQTGSGFAWCQSSWGFVNAGVTSTVEVDLTDSMSCDAAALADVRGVYVWFQVGAASTPITCEPNSPSNNREGVSCLLNASMSMDEMFRSILI